MKNEKRSAPAFCAVFAWFVLVAAEFVLDSGGRSMVSVLSGLGLAVGAGLLFTVIARGGYWGVGFLPKRFRWAFWVAAGGLVGAWLAWQLGAFVRLGTTYNALAMLTIGVAIVGGGMGGVIAGAFQPDAKGRGHLFMRLRPRLRGIGAALLILAALGCVYFDRVFYRGLYETAHLAMRMGAVLSASFGVTALRSLLPIPVPKRRWGFPVVAGIAVAFALVPFFLLTPPCRAALQQIGNRPFAATALGLFRGLTDVDFDGYSSLLAGRDCAAFDPAVNPRAREIPDNGLDENCSGQDRRKGALSDVADVPVPHHPSTRNVILFTIDSVRADHLSLYGYDLDPMPRLTKWAEDAVVFKRAYASAPWTGISVPSFLRGLFPRRMQWRRYIETTENRLLRHPIKKKRLHRGEQSKRSYLLPSPRGSKPLAFWLKRRGMATAAVVNDGYSRMLTDTPGLSAGFDTYEVVDDAACQKESGDVQAVSMAVKRWKQLVNEEPYFLWVHLFGAHVGRFKIPEKYQKFSPSQPNNYDDKLYFSDDMFYRFVSAVERRRHRLPLVVAVSADHGEVIDGKRMWHGNGLGEDVIRVPLIMKIPGQQPRQINTPVGTIDLAPTILSLTHTPAPEMDGIDLTTLLKGKGPIRRFGLVSDNWRVKSKGRVSMDITAIYDGQYKLQIDHLTGIESLVSQKNPDEDLSEHIMGKRAAALRQKLNAYLEAGIGPIVFKTPSP